MTMIVVRRHGINIRSLKLETCIIHIMLNWTYVYQRKTFFICWLGKRPIQLVSAFWWEQITLYLLSNWRLKIDKNIVNFNNVINVRHNRIMNVWHWCMVISPFDLYPTRNRSDAFFYSTLFCLGTNVRDPVDCILNIYTMNTNVEYPLESSLRTTIYL